MIPVSVFILSQTFAFVKPLFFISVIYISIYVGTILKKQKKHHFAGQSFPVAIGFPQFSAYY